MDHQVISRIVALVTSELAVPPGQIDANSSMDTVPEWDSMAQLMICMALQESFGVTLDMTAIEEATSVGALAKIVEEARS